ncbi:Hypothetical protein PAU_00904 [Photorhabdus asymbiotica]|uniref:Uncharacterized protein n=1 Tax=Photorhabdus asymbiotica subsp. asymbiotica (strain ATCC 43949 / 3105-77) TaxID=553480 RepID=B6VMV3_PHOAA|nr:Hypothetical protein PAU_00904 [Photorhabdus asymbiotica]CAR67483.1 Hypothetical protein PA-RVA14-1107 [Photorhabdus asymbiotica subsp. asymbiotica ATCC 43949]
MYNNGLKKTTCGGIMKPYLLNKFLIKKIINHRNNNRFTGLSLSSF